jgi:hypothetical protein
VHLQLSVRGFHFYFEEKTTIWQPDFVEFDRRTIRKLNGPALGTHPTLTMQLLNA